MKFKKVAKLQKKDNSRKLSLGNIQNDLRRLPIQLPSNYKNVLSELKERIKRTQLKAVAAANRELIILYFYIGQKLIEQDRRADWGDRVVERLSEDLRLEFPEMKGFSRSNLFYMRQFYLAYKNANKLVQQLVGLIPWGHNVVILSKVKNAEERKWYLQKTIDCGWSRNILALQIENNLYHREGKAVTNFKQMLPPQQSDLANQSLKDPYVFDFLSLTSDMQERELEKGLVEHIERFLIELGVGFAFVGRQVHLEVDGDDFYIDLLFYHLKLRCYVVIELKTAAFKPEFAGKLNFYLSAVDDLLRHPDDKPTIGLLLCKSKKRFQAEYALRDIKKPIGIADWKVRIVKSLPEGLKSSLPTIEELEQEFAAELEKR